MQNTHTRTHARTHTHTHTVNSCTVPVWVFIMTKFWLMAKSFTLQIPCAIVTGILHYLFLAVFSWMLCEGVMLYLMLVKVFSSLPKKLWFFLLLGYGEYQAYIHDTFLMFSIIYGQYCSYLLCYSCLLEIRNCLIKMLNVIKYLAFGIFRRSLSVVASIPTI